MSEKTKRYAAVMRVLTPMGFTQDGNNARLIGDLHISVDMDDPDIYREPDPGTIIVRIRHEAFLEGASETRRRIREALGIIQ